MITCNTIELKLRELGLRKGMYVEVHSSLSSFGQVDGGAKVVIRALQNIITPDGAIIMTSFPMSKQIELTEEDKERGITCKIKILDSNTNERTGMGIVADTFRRMPDVLTGEGMYRVSAWGAEQDKNSKGLSNLHLKDGYGLLIGVDIYRLTSMHYVEDNLPAEIEDIFKPSAEVQNYYPKDEWYIETGTPPERAWYKVQDQAYANGYIKDINIGNAKCMFFKVNNVINLYKGALESDPLSLYGLKKLI
ncbi:MAG: aminoglycoside 3-N-acetyltransferase [Firmicutes bacterium]|nr:aminoglycoside 3-N-acetyltransferase [Bacillota bacterium]